MEYTKIDELKVTCIATQEDMSFMGISIDDILDRSEAGFHFLKRTKELAGINQNVVWTNIAYTLQISLLPDQSVSLTFSERIDDYIESLKHSMGIADSNTSAALKEFIQALEGADEESARIMVSHFEKNIRNTKA